MVSPIHDPVVNLLTQWRKHNLITNHFRMEVFSLSLFCTLLLRLSQEVIPNVWFRDSRKHVD